MYSGSFKQHFNAIDDHRQSAKTTYALLDILFDSLGAVIAGSNGGSRSESTFSVTTIGS
jgi:hypothetical protein